MVSSGMLRGVALVITDVSEERSASFIRVTRIGEPGTKLAVTSNRQTLRRNTKWVIFLRSVRQLLVTASVVSSSPILLTLMKEALSSSETSVLTTATRRNNPKYDILRSHRREYLKFYIHKPSNSEFYTPWSQSFLHYLSFWGYPSSSIHPPTATSPKMPKVWGE
jgi:hypothetical protein